MTLVCSHTTIHPGPTHAQSQSPLGQFLRICPTAWTAQHTHLPGHPAVPVLEEDPKEEAQNREDEALSRYPDRLQTSSTRQVPPSTPPILGCSCLSRRRFCIWYLVLSWYSALGTFASFRAWRLCRRRVSRVWMGSWPWRFGVNIRSCLCMDS